MENSKNQPSLFGSNNWAEIFIRTIAVAVVAFVALQAKEWFNAGMLDVPGVLADAGLVAGGMLVLYVIVKMAKI